MEFQINFYVTISRIFNDKYQNVDFYKRCFTDRPRINESIGFDVLNKKSSASRKLQEPCKLIGSNQFHFIVLHQAPRSLLHLLKYPLAHRPMKPVEVMKCHLLKFRNVRRFWSTLGAGFLISSTKLQIKIVHCNGSVDRSLNTTALIVMLQTWNISNQLLPILTSSI